MTATPQVQLVATVCSGPSVGLAFVVSSEIPCTVSVWAPVTPFQLRAFVDGEEVEIIRPPLDLPAIRQSWSTGPERPATIPCPVLLVFGDSGMDGDGLTWTIRRTPAPSTIDITCGLELDGVPIPAPTVHVNLEQARQ